MKLMVRLLLVFIFQLSALDALAGMVEMDHSTTEHTFVAGHQSTQLSDYCDEVSNSGNHCHCVVCIAVVETSSFQGKTDDSQQFLAQITTSKHPYYEIFKPPQ
jgi:hypothetical protein